MTVMNGRLGMKNVILMPKKSVFSVTSFEGLCLLFLFGPPAANSIQNVCNLVAVGKSYTWFPAMLQTWKKVKVMPVSPTHFKARCNHNGHFGRQWGGQGDACCSANCKGFFCCFKKRKFLLYCVGGAITHNKQRARFFGKNGHTFLGIVNNIFNLQSTLHDIHDVWQPQ